MLKYDWVTQLPTNLFITSSISGKQIEILGIDVVSRRFVVFKFISKAVSLIGFVISVTF